MLLYAWFLPAVCFCYSSAEIPKVTALQHSDAVLTCPHAQGDVTWSRHTKTGEVQILTIRNGRVNSSEQRFSSRENHELVIRNVVDSDTSMYLCKGKKTVYLEVTVDPNKVDPKDQPVTPRHEQETAGGADINQTPSDLWKFPVAVLGGVALVLLSTLTLRLWKAKKAARDASRVETGQQVVYEEIRNRDVEPSLTESEVESPYYCSEIRDPPNTCTAPTPPLYSTVRKPTPEGRAAENCVYYVPQNPSQTS